MLKGKSSDRAAKRAEAARQLAIQVASAWVREFFGTESPYPEPVIKYAERFRSGQTCIGFVASDPHRGRSVQVTATVWPRIGGLIATEFDALFL